MNNIETEFKEIEQAYKEGKITKDEYASLIAGLDIETFIHTNANELKNNIELHNAMTLAVSIAKSVI